MPALSGMRTRWCRCLYDIRKKLKLEWLRNNENQGAKLSQFRQALKTLGRPVEVGRDKAA